MKMKRFFKNKTIQYILQKKHILMLMIALSTMFLGIGYAQISDITLSVNGTASANGQQGIVLSDVSYLSNNNADLTNSNINTYYGTLMDSKIVLGNTTDSSITYQVSIKNINDEEKVFKGVTYDSSFYDNPNIDFEINGMSINETLAPGEEKTLTITFKYKEPQNTSNNTLNSLLNFKFTKSPSTIDEYTPSGLCEFHGQNNDIIGDCAGGQHIDYIDTGISLFSAANKDKDFEIGFTVDSIDPSRFRSGKVDTIFDCLYDTGTFPGIAFRIEDSKWYLQVGKGSSNKKLKFNKDDIQSFVLKKINNKVYYSINGGADVYVEDLSTIPTFDNPLTFGTSLLPDGTPREERFLIADLSNLYVKITEPVEPEEPEERTYATVDQEILTFMGQTMVTAYSSSGPHVFDATANNIIDTGVELLSSTNYQKSFIITFTIDEFIKANNVNQATLFNIKDESNTNYPGLMMRLSSNKYELAMKDGTGQIATVTLPLTIKRINIIKKGMTMYYQVDLEDIQPLSNNNNFENYPVENTFNIPTTFGCNINGEGNYDRMIVGTLSDMKIQVST